MNSLLTDKKILLGISAGIAAYKCPDLVRQLRAQGANVHVVMTAHAEQFVAPLALQAVAGHQVHQALFPPRAEDGMDHIQLAKWADLILLAPSTANLIAKLASGLADDLLTTLCLASSAPLFLLPAMNQQMYRATATQTNLATLAQRGVTICGPAQGEQACGDIGPGRMLEPVEIVAMLQDYYQQRARQDWQHIRLLVSAGPTQEPLDPVRYISNHSSGKMGFAIAAAAAQRGADVTLVSGPVSLTTPANVNRIEVVTAQQMHQQVLQHCHQADIFISCAAVADYRAEHIAPQKIKKQTDKLSLTLLKNPDIIADVARLADPPYCVGFAAESEHLARYAREKLQNKKLNLICANNISQPEQGFNSDYNALHLFWKGGEKQLPRASKQQLSHQLLDEIIKQYDEKN